MEKEQLQQEEELEIDLAELSRAVLKRWKFVARCVLIGLVIGGIYCLVASPKYESTALLRVKSSKGGISFNPINAVMGGGLMASQQVATYSEILKSRGVVEPVLKHIEEDFPEIPHKKQPKYEGFIKKRMEVEPVETSDLLKVTTNAKTAEYAQKLNNYLLESFQNKLNELGQVEQRALGKFLKERSQQAKKELNDLETKLRDFLVKNKYFTPGERADFLSGRLTRLDSEIAANEIAESMNLSGLKVVKEQLAKAGVISVAVSPATESVRNAITALELEKINCIDKYTDKHPNVQVIQNRIAELKKKLNVEINKVVKLKAPSTNEIHQGLIGSKLGHEAALVSIVHKRKLLEELSSRYDKEIEKLPALDQEYVLLKRDCGLAGEIYAMLARRYEEARIAEAMEVGDIQVVDAGNLPEKPSSPKILKILFICAFLGGFFSVGHITWRFIFKATINAEGDITKHLGLPVLGSIPDEEFFVNARKAKEKKGLWKNFSLKRFNL
ncbi:MAG: GumC family protein [Synergistaceae bacterium]|nr:GumC family protein [Synergistaceae bacterium]